MASPSSQQELDQSQRAHSTLSPSPAPSQAPSHGQHPQSQGGTQQRVLACVMCQQRKVKCNRKFPCNNCIRMRTTCVPATQNPRRSRRRFPERVLLDRVRSYEGLLRQHHVRFESLFQTEGGPSRDEGGGEGDDDGRGYRNRDGGEREDVVMDSDGDVARSRTADTPDAARSPLPGGPVEKGVDAKNFWKAIRKGFHDRIRDDDDDDDDGSSSDNTEIRRNVNEMWQRQLGSTGSFFFRGPHKALANVSALHPGPVQIFRLWQTYLDNVDPLLKITHTPTLQGRIVEAASNIGNIDSTLEALMFSIYCIAIYSMTPGDCKAIFSASKDDLLAAYQPACEQALLNSSFLRTNNRDCLTAFFLYLLSLGHTLDPKSLYSMLGVATRLCENMRFNNEVPSAKLAPLEAEMRRRLWWAIALFDSRIGELAHHSPTVMDPTWDCHVPLNANDFDFRPEMKDAPIVQGHTSEALFAVVRGELGDAMRHMEYYLSLVNPALKHMARTPQLSGAAAKASSLSLEFGELDALEALINEKYLQYCDPANALHFMTIWTAKGFLAKCRLIKYFSKFSGFAQSLTAAASTHCSTPTSTATDHAAATATAEALSDRALEDAMMTIESDTQIMISPLTKGFRWLLHLYFPMPAYIHVTQELARRISGERASRAWACMNDNYEARFAQAESENRYMLKFFASTILQAWETCEARLREAGESHPVPDMVVRIRRQLSEEGADGQAGADAQGFGYGGTGGEQQPASTSGMSVGMGGLDFGTADVSGVSGISGAPPPLFGGMAGGGGTTPTMFPSPNMAAMGFGVGNLGSMGSWPQMPWAWQPRPPWS